MPFVYLGCVPKNEPSRVRFSEEQNEVLKKIAAACDVSEVTVARWAVEALGDYWRHHKERLLLPLRFHETFSVTVLDPMRPMILPDPLHELESGGSGAAGRSRKSGRSRVSRA